MRRWLRLLRLSRALQPTSRLPPPASPLPFPFAVLPEFGGDYGGGDDAEMAAAIEASALEAALQASRAAAALPSTAGAAAESGDVKDE